MHDRKHLSDLWKARGRIELSMIVTYFQCLTLRVRSGHLRQDPLDLGFWSFLNFLHRGIEEVERHLL